MSLYQFFLPSFHHEVVLFTSGVSLSYNLLTSCLFFTQSTNGPPCADNYWADYTTGSCIKDCCPGDEGEECWSAPPPIMLWPSIEACCREGIFGVNYDFCTSRSNNFYTDQWVVDWDTETCGELYICYDWLAMLLMYDLTNIYYSQSRIVILP